MGFISRMRSMFGGNKPENKRQAPTRYPSEPKTRSSFAQTPVAGRPSMETQRRRDSDMLDPTNPLSPVSPFYIGNSSHGSHSNIDCSPSSSYDSGSSCSSDSGSSSSCGCD